MLLCPFAAGEGGGGGGHSKVFEGHPLGLEGSLLKGNYEGSIRELERIFKGSIRGCGVGFSGRLQSTPLMCKPPSPNIRWYKHHTHTESSACWA